MDQFTLEHLDPRDHHLICGFHEGPLAYHNEMIASQSYNSRKNNRFVPYRIKEYPAPREFGDTCEFLIQGEWTICEFGGEEWWGESNRLGNAHTKGGYKTGRDNFLKIGRENALLKRGFLTPEYQSKAGKIGGPIGGRATRGLLWWVNQKGETTKSIECPGVGWQRGRKYKN